jgi:hypothetical protein
MRLGKMQLPRARGGVPDKNKSPKAYKRYLKRLREVDALLSKGHIPAHAIAYKVKSVVSGGLPSLGKR